jgi:hypothetical protein
VCRREQSIERREQRGAIGVGVGHDEEKRNTQRLALARLGDKYGIGAERVRYVAALERQRRRHARLGTIQEVRSLKRHAIERLA